MPDDSDRAWLTQMANEVKAIHQPKTQVSYTGINPEWDWKPTADLDKAMVRQESTVCTAGCGEWPCETLKTVNRG